MEPKAEKRVGSLIENVNKISAYESKNNYHTTNHHQPYTAVATGRYSQSDGYSDLLETARTNALYRVDARTDLLVITYYHASDGSAARHTANEIARAVYFMDFTAAFYSVHRHSTVIQ